MYICEWSAGRKITGTQACPAPSPTFSLSLYGWDRVWSSTAAGRTEAPGRSYVEAFSTATRSLDVGIVEDKLA